MARERSREPDPYEVLGLDVAASSADISRAYRRLARALHPDSRPARPDAADQFRVVSAAYELLSDPARRASYDRWRESSDARRAAYDRRRVAGGLRPERAAPGPATVHGEPGFHPRRGARSGEAANRPPGPGVPLWAGPVHVEPPARRPEAAGSPAGRADEAEMIQRVIRLLLGWPG